MIKTQFQFMFTGIVVILMFLSQSPVSAEMEERKTGVPARLAADYVHAAIDAGRRVYSEHIVDRLDEKISLKATENWQEEKTLLLPAQFLLTSSQLSNSRGIGMSYRLMSLWPINPNNSPKTENETIGLQKVAEGWKELFTWVVQRRGIWYFQAIYPDVAITPSCASCHNRHPKSPKTDFKVGDVMGGIIINIPLGKHTRKKADEEFMLAPEVVADYVHTILESDRTVYAQQIVDRLENNNILHATENWKEENTLLLPAQFLMNSAELIKQSDLDLDFRLISLWPINDENGPSNEFERIGLETVDIHPIRPYIGFTTVGRRKYFQAIYPDFAVTENCVNCHNAHPKSPRHNFKLDDVMGGIRVNFPLK